jgi:integrase
LTDLPVNLRKRPTVNDISYRACSDRLAQPENRIEQMQRPGHNPALPTANLRVIVVPEAHSGLPLKGDFERMARRRFQNPRPFREGNWWWINPRQDELVNGKIVRKKKRIKLAPSSVGEREARRIADEVLRPMNQGLETISSVTQFGAYVNSTYKSTVMPLLATTTQNNYQYVLQKHLLPTFFDMALRDMKTIALQKYFSNAKVSHATATKIKDVLTSVLGSAVRYGLLTMNPLIGVRIRAAQVGKRAKPHITPEQFDSLISLMAEPYATMVYVCVMTGLRVSELIGLRWEDVHDDSLTIDERFCRGDWGCPKTAASSATISVDAEVIRRIHQVKDVEVTINWGANSAKKTFKLVRSDKPLDLVFQSLRKGAPMSDHNILSRHIKPAGRKIGIGWVNWQALRRSYATWMAEAGADPKAVQGQMRHSRISTTMDVYAQFVPESQRRAVAKMMDMVIERTAKSRAMSQQVIN